MKKHDAAKRHAGFFDLGFSMAVLALAGVFAYAVTPGDDARAAAQDPQIEVVANLETAERYFDLQ